MCIVLCPNIVQITMCFFIRIPCHTSPSMRHHEVDAYKDRSVLSYRARFDTTLRNKGYCKSWNAQIDTNHCVECQQNVPQHYYLLDTFVLHFYDSSLL